MARVSFIHAALMLTYNGADITGLARNAATPIEDLWVSLHTAKPEDNDQSSFEVVYPGYTRTSVPRSEIGWVVNENSVNPVGNIDFPAITQDLGNDIEAKYFSVGTNKEGSGWILHSGMIEPGIPLKRNTIPRLNTDTSITIVQQNLVRTSVTQ